MMINKRLIGMVSESKTYIACNVALQWCALAANIAMIGTICRLLEQLYRVTAGTNDLLLTAAIALAALAVRFGCNVGSARMGFLSSKAVKKTLREKIYAKLLRLGSAYREQAQTSEVVQVAVEGIDQQETYFCAYLPQFCYAMLAPLTLFVVLCFVNVPAALVLLVCVPMIPIAIAAVQTWAKKLLSKYWDQYTALGDTLSGGERQRLGLARAFLHDAPFLLLDEPTSNLDSLNEAVILRSLGEERQDKTVVLVSHRKSTMRIADTVYSVECGRLS